MIALAGRPSRPHSGIAATNLDNPGAIGIDRSDPVETVAAEIENSAAAKRVILERCKGRVGPVFGVGPGYDDLVLREQLRPASMHVLVRDDVEGMRQPLEPAEKEKVDREVPVTASEPIWIMGTCVEERAPATAVANRAPVLVPVIAGCPKFGVRVDEGLIVGDHALMPHDRAHVGRCEMVVGVGQVGVGRRNEQDVGALASGAHEQRVKVRAPPASRRTA